MVPKTAYLKIVSLFVVLFITACSGNGQNKGTNTPPKDSLAKVRPLTIEPGDPEEENTADSMLVNRDKQIAGTWTALDGSEDLTIAVSKDSIFYVEHSESHRYELKKDSIFIHYPDYTLAGKPLLLKDTFAIVTEDHVSKFARQKN